MKTLLLLITAFISIHLSAQKTEAYYDYMWKPSTPEKASFYSEVTKTDSGWLRHDYFLGTKTLQMSGLYEDSANKIANGFFRYFYANRVLERSGRYVHNKEEGLWIGYHHNGGMIDSTWYMNGKPSGTSLGWFSNGYLSDSSVFSPDGSAVVFDWSTNGMLSDAGRLMNGELNGTWQFFHNNGRLAAREVYNMGKLVSRAYYDTAGVQEDTASKDRNATFPGGEAAWDKIIYKHMHYPSQYKIVGGDKVIVVVTATIDEEGNVSEPFVEIPVHKEFDKIAITIFEKPQKWLPAIKHNRAVAERIGEPFTFIQRD